MSVRRQRRGERRRRAQATLAVLGVALVAIVAVATLGLVVADGAFAGADREAGDRRVAVSLSERLVAPDGPLTDRANVLNASRLRRFDATRLRAAFPVADGHDVRVSLDGEALATVGDPRGGTTIRRVVLVRNRTAVTIEPPLPAGGARAVTLPRRTPRVDLHLDPPAGTTVEAVRANGRVVLHDASGLHGNLTLSVSRFETTRLRFDADGPLPRGSVRVTYYPARTTKALLAVTVDG